MVLGACVSSPDGARVTRVIDGDTVEMERLGRVRLIGVDTPEERRCYENEATRFTRDRLEGEVVQYELGVDRKDRNGRTLAYLTREGQMHNEVLLSEGLAKVLTIPPNDKYEPRFEEAEREAQTTDAGLWDRCDRNKIRAQRAAAERKRGRTRARRIRRARIRNQARRQRAADRRRAQRAAGASPPTPREDRPTPPPEDSSGGSGGDSGGNGGSCLPSSACPGKRDGDDDGCYCE